MSLKRHYAILVKQVFSCPPCKQFNQSATALERMAEQISDAGSALKHSVDSSAKDLQRFTSGTLPEASVMVVELRQTAENLRRMSEQLERDPSVLFYGAPPPALGPGE